MTDFVIQSKLLYLCLPKCPHSSKTVIALARSIYRATALKTVKFYLNIKYHHCYELGHCQAYKILIDKIRWKKGDICPPKFSSIIHNGRDMETT